jgi:hypothetical protein
MSPPVAVFVSRLHGRRSGKGWIAKCPAHDDRTPSLSINEGRDGRMLLKCFAGCTFDQIVSAAGLTTEDLFPEPVHGQSGNGATTKSAATFDWQKCVAAFSDKHVEQIAKWRGYSLSFVKELRDQARIGIYDGLVAFPVHNGGKVVGTHYRLKSGKWRFFPTGIKAAPLVFGNLILRERVNVFESTWDGLDYMDKSCERDGVIITRGASNGARVAALIPDGSIAYIWTQNDKGGADLESALAEHAAATVTVRRVCIPALHKDLNDWTRAGAALVDLIAAKANAEIIREAQTAERETEKKRKKESAASRLVAFVIDQDGGRQDASGRNNYGPFSLFHDPHDRAFARYQAKDHVEAWPVESSKFKKILAQLYYNNTGKIINRNSLVRRVPLSRS